MGRTIAKIFSLKPFYWYPLVIYKGWKVKIFSHSEEENSVNTRQALQPYPNPRKGWLTNEFFATSHWNIYLFHLPSITARSKHIKNTHMFVYLHQGSATKTPQGGWWGNEGNLSYSPSNGNERLPLVDLAKTCFLVDIFCIHPGCNRGKWRFRFGIPASKKI